SQTNEEQRFVRTFKRRSGRQPRKLRHETHKVDARHFRDERIAFRHVADQRLDLICLAANVAAQNSRGAGGWLVKAKQSVNQGCFARAVWSQQTNRASTQITAKIFENGT